MKLVKTTVTDEAIRLRFADEQEPWKAKQWIDLRLPTDRLVLPDKTVLGALESHTLAEVRLGALQRALDVIDAEIQDVATRLGQKRQ